METEDPLMENRHAPKKEDEVEEEEEEAVKNLKCGIFSWRPDCLQRCANLRTFTLTLSTLSVLGNMNYSYYTAVITQIEKNFGLSSSWTGLIKNIDNIGNIAFSLLVSHFCRYANLPRLFAAATVLSSLAIFIFALPHFIYGGGSMPDLNGTDGLLNSTHKKYELCGDQSGASGSCSGGTSNLHAFNVGALALFIVSELLQGIAQSPKFTLSITYVDDNSKKNSPKHMGE